jgi:hypothetical protein
LFCFRILYFLTFLVLLQHATSAIDYRMSKEFRLAATVYVADINEENVDAIMNHYTQPYPPKNRDTLLGWAGTHWKKDDPTASLPKLGSDHVLRRNSAPSVD